MFSTDIGIDLGTCNTLVCVKGEGVIITEPSVVAVKKGTNKVLLGGQAVGNVAKEMLGKTPGGIMAVRPLRDGVISDFDLAEALIRYFIQKVRQHKGWKLIKPRVAISIPSGISTVEKRAVINSSERAGSRKIYLVVEPVAAAIGIGLPIQEPVASMIVDIGGGTTEVAVLSLGGIVTSKSIRVAGDEMDGAITQHMKTTYNLLIGEQMAERVKITIGSAFPLDKEITMEVGGRDLVAARPRKIIVNSEEIREALKKPIDLIVQAIKETLEKTPPELSADLINQGLVLVGGGSLLRGLDKAISKEIQIPVRVDDEPLTAVAKGTGIILENLDQIRESLESGEDLL
ncbi:MAG: rod shape-determining protein [Planctomycetes bacterium]|nr:rod shape-determining protein [Planctomycetota bacterium]MCK5579597.1 rod shape-determining protein [Planctomycetota bacterium]